MADVILLDGVERMIFDRKRKYNDEERNFSYFLCGNFKISFDR